MIRFFSALSAAAAPLMLPAISAAAGAIVSPPRVIVTCVDMKKREEEDMRKQKTKCKRKRKRGIKSMTHRLKIEPCVHPDNDGRDVRNGGERLGERAVAPQSAVALEDNEIRGAAHFVRCAVRLLRLH